MISDEHRALLRRVQAAGSAGWAIVQGWLGATLLLGAQGALTVKNNKAWLTREGERAVRGW